MNSIDMFQDHTFLTSQPASHSVSPNGRLTIVAPPLVDWWRSPEPVPVNRRDGVFFGRPVDATRPFRCGVWLRSCLSAEYDQACLVVHGGDMSDNNVHWLKTGTETFTEKEWINAVVSTPWCDVSATRSRQPLSSGVGGDWVYLEITKEQSITGHTILVKWTSRPHPIPIEDIPATDLDNLREVQAFNVDDKGDRAAAKVWYIGPMVSGLLNESGASGEFQGFWLQYLDQ